MQTCRRLFSSVRGAVEIYRSRDLTSVSRGIGFCCIGHSLVWFGVTVSQGWFREEKREMVVADLKEIWIEFKRFAGMNVDRPSLEEDEVASSSLVSDPEGSSFFSRLKARQQTFHENTKKYDRSMTPILTMLFAASTVVIGYFLPRRMVRSVTMIPRQMSPGTVRQGPPNHLIQIETYSAFGLSTVPVRFQVPMDRVRTFGSRGKDSTYMHFYVKYVPFRFIMEKEGAEFSDPNECDSIFSSGGKLK